MVEIKLNKRYKYAGDIMPKLLEFGFDLETACDFLNSIKDADVVPKSEWISVDERLPESTDPATPVLVFTKQNRYYVGCYYKAVVYDEFTGFYAEGVRLKVTHWMPLPEPPITDKPTQEQ